MLSCWELSIFVSSLPRTEIPFSSAAKQSCAPEAASVSGWRARTFSSLHQPPCWSGRCSPHRDGASLPHPFYFCLHTQLLWRDIADFRVPGGRGLCLSQSPHSTQLWPSFTQETTSPPAHQFTRSNAWGLTRLLGLHVQSSLSFTWNPPASCLSEKSFIWSQTQTIQNYWLCFYRSLTRIQTPRGQDQCLIHLCIPWRA